MDSNESAPVVGRLVPYKRVDLVLQALARLRAAWPDLELVVIGRGPEHDRLAALARELGPGRRVVTVLCDTGERYFSLDEYFK